MVDVSISQTGVIDDAPIKQFITDEVAKIPKPQDGEDGKDSTVPGPPGKSAYEVAVANGFSGTEAQWLASLKGADGQNATGGSGSSPVYVGLPSTVITDPNKVADGVNAWIANRNGAFPKTQLVFGFIGTANLTAPLFPDNMPALQGVRVLGQSKRGTVIRYSGSSPLASFYGNLRNWVFEDFTLQSGGTNTKGFYFRSDQNKFNQDGVFRRIEHMGSWQYAYGFDGDGTANLNSEILFDQVAMANDAAFGTAYFWCGMTDGNNGSGGAQNQFLNYHFENTKLEGASGDYIRFDYGGSLSVGGYNSWIHVGAAGGRMIYLKNGYTGDSTMRAVIDSVRAELRNPTSIFIDNNWAGGAAHVAIRGLSSGANAFKFPTPTEQYSLRAGTSTHISDSHLQGFIGTYGNARVVLDETTGAQKQTPQNLVHAIQGTPTTIIR